MQYYAGVGHRETPGEEIANAITHGAGVLASVAALVLLVVAAVHHADAMKIVTLSVFGASLVIMYLSSTLYHALTHERAKAFFLLCDYACIYLLIAATYTPFMLVTLGGAWGWSIFGVMWGLAAIGITLKLLAGQRYRILSVALYIAMGWMMIVCIVPMVQALSTPGLVMIFAGGACYTLGVVFFLWDHLPYNHAVWHVFVMAGSACHAVAAYFDVVGR